MDYGAARNRNKRIDKYKPSFLNRNNDRKKSECRFVSAGYCSSFSYEENGCVSKYQTWWQTLFKVMGIAEQRVLVSVEGEIMRFSVYRRLMKLIINVKCMHWK